MIRGWLAGMQLFDGGKQSPRMKQAEQHQQGVATCLLAEADVHCRHSQQQSCTEGCRDELCQATGQTKQDRQAE